jgi:hypothetical protein
MRKNKKFIDPRYFMDEKLEEVLWKVEYNKKGEPRPATGKQEKGKHTKEVEAGSAEEAQRELVKAGHHVVKTSKVEKEGEE